MNAAVNQHTPPFAGGAALPSLAVMIVIPVAHQDEWSASATQ
jgi:hypothetical protein